MRHISTIILIIQWLWRQPRNRRAADVVAPPNLRKRFLAAVPPQDRLRLLVVGQLEGTAKALALRLGAAAALAGAGLDKLPLELRQPAKHGQHQPPVCCGGVGPCVGNGAEARPLVGNGFQGVQQVERRTRQPVESRHQKHVTGGQMVKSAAKLGAVSLRTACHLAEHLDGSGSGQGRDLRFDALTVRGYPCIAVNHARIMTVTYAKESPFRINGLGFLHKC